MISLVKLLQKQNINNVLKLIHYKKPGTIAPRSFCTKSLDVNTNVVKDVILFKYDNSRFFKIISIFGLCQFGFWTYLSLFAYNQLRDIPVTNSEETAWWRQINLGESKYRYGISIVSFVIGWGFLSISWMYALKSVKYLILRKGGKELTLVTHTPTGHNRMFTLGLENVSCKESRATAKSQLPLKVKGHYLHYVLDMRGEFRNPQLFDYTAGLRRKWK